MPTLLYDVPAIKARVSILDLLETDGMQPRRSGANFIVCCPFHEERTGSFTIFPDGGYQCFGCGESGDVISYVQRSRGLSFPEAAQLLQDRAGIAPIAPPMTRAAVKRKAHAMSAEERAACTTMAEDLLRSEKALNGIADSRGWQPATIQRLAFDPCIGLHEGKLVYLYQTGAKKRLKPLTPDRAAAFAGVGFVWLFGKPHSLWRADAICKSTATVHIAEGETAAISLIDARLDNGSSEIVVAVANASAWWDEWRPLFEGRCVVIWPDADDAGEKLKERVINSLARAARSIEVASTKGANQ